MTYLLLIIAFNGNVQHTYYLTHALCEEALFVATDEGKFKELKVAECLTLDKEVDKTN